MNKPERKETAQRALVWVGIALAVVVLLVLLWYGLYLGIQIAESYILAPLVHQKAVYIPPALILFSQVLFGVIAGGLGVAVATPLAAAATVAIHRLYVEDVLGDKSRGIS